MANPKIKILHFGLGPVGQKIALFASRQSFLQSVSAVDIDPNLCGKNLMNLLGTKNGSFSKVIIENKIKRHGAQVAVHCTRSWLKDIESELAELLKLGLNVISTAEELVFPVKKNNKIIERLDRIAKRNKVSLLGVGVNPGFVLDLLPVLSCRVSTNVEHVHGQRVVDLGKRRLPLQRKVGVGLSVEEFGQKAKQSQFGHQGMIESLLMIAKGIGLKINRNHLSIEPLTSPKALKTDFFEVPPGKVCGLHQKAIGYSKDQREIIRIEVKMVIGGDPEKGSFDSIKIKGIPPLDLFIQGGIYGEDATASAVINSIPLVKFQKPGFCTLLDLPLNVPL